MDEFTKQPSLIDKLIKKKIIVIDDDPMVLKTIREFLADSYDVAVARSGSNIFFSCHQNSEVKWNLMCLKSSWAMERT